MKEVCTKISQQGWGGEKKSTQTTKKNCLKNSALR